MLHLNAHFGILANYRKADNFGVQLSSDITFGTEKWLQSKIVMINFVKLSWSGYLANRIH